MTPAQIREAIEQFNNFEQEKHKQSLRNVRLTGFYFAISMGAKIRKPEDLGLFEFEDKKKAKVIKWRDDQHNTKN
jgi:hypothetical protein